MKFNRFLGYNYPKCNKNAGKNHVITVGIIQERNIMVWWNWDATCPFPLLHAGKLLYRSGTPDLSQLTRTAVCDTNVRLPFALLRAR